MACDSCAGSPKLQSFFQGCHLCSWKLCEWKLFLPAKLGRSGGDTAVLEEWEWVDGFRWTRHSFGLMEIAELQGEAFPLAPGGWEACPPGHGARTAACSSSGANTLQVEQEVGVLLAYELVMYEWLVCWLVGWYWFRVVRCLQIF